MLNYFLKQNCLNFTNSQISTCENLFMISDDLSLTGGSYENLESDKFNQFMRKIILNKYNASKTHQDNTATSEQRYKDLTSRGKLLKVSSPDSLVIQPSSCTAGKAVIVCCPQLGWCGHLSRDFLADLVGICKWKGVAGAGSLVVKHHTYTSRHTQRQTYKLKKSINQWDVINKHVIVAAQSNMWNFTDEHTEKLSLVFSTNTLIKRITQLLKWKTR